MEDVRNIRLQELDQTDRSPKGYTPALSLNGESKIENKLEPDILTDLYNQGSNSITVFGNDIKQKSSFKTGNVYSLIYLDEEPLIIIGPQYYMSLLLFLILLGFSILFVYLIDSYLPLSMRLIAYFIYLYQLITQLYCTINNPGIPHRNNFISERIRHLISQGLQEDPNYLNKYKICKKCNIIIPADTPVTHCDICNICCERMDHHCLWIGKCIGRKNLCSFYLFLSGLFLYFIFFVLCVAYGLYTRFSNDTLGKN